MERGHSMNRRTFIAGLGSAPVGPLVVRAQQPAMPVIGWLSGRSLATDEHLVAAFRRGLSEHGYTDGQNVPIQYRWAEGQFNRLSGMAADLVALNVAVIFIGGADIEMRALTAAVSKTPIVFAAAGDQSRARQQPSSKQKRRPRQLGMTGPRSDHRAQGSTAVCVVCAAVVRIIVVKVVAGKGSWSARLTRSYRLDPHSLPHSCATLGFGSGLVPARRAWFPSRGDRRRAWFPSRGDRRRAWFPSRG